MLQLADVISGYTLPSQFWWASSGTTSIGIKPGGLSGAHISWYKGGQATTYQVQYRERARFSPSGYTAAGVSPVNQWGDWGAWQDPDGDVAGDTASSVSISGRVVTYQAHYWGYAYDIATYDMYQIQLRVRVFDEPSQTASEWAYATFNAVICPTATLTALPNANGGYTVSVVLSGWQRGGNSVTISDTKYCMLNARNQNMGPWWNNAPFWAGCTAGLTATGGSFDVPPAAVSHGRIYAATLQVVTADGGAAVLDSSNVYAYDCAADSKAQSTQHAAGAVVYMVPVGTHEDPSGVTAPTITATPDSEGNFSVRVSGAEWDGCSVWYTWTDARGVTRHEQAEAAQVSARVWGAQIIAPPFDTTVQISVAVTKNGDWLARTVYATVPSSGAVELRRPGTGECLRILYNARDTVQRRFTGDVETVKPAGTARPKSRYGTGGAMSLSVSGLVPAEDATDGYLTEAALSEFVQLESAGDWLLRLPGGERYTVALMSYTLNNAAPVGFYEVGLELEAVEA